MKQHIMIASDHLHQITDCKTLNNRKKVARYGNHEYRSLATPLPSLLLNGS